MQSLTRTFSLANTTYWSANNMFDLKRAKIQSFLDNAKTPEEVELGEALLEGYDSGELEVLTDVATGETLFTLKEAN
tara:strand:- start:73 stop:303 length:231 start_codon:yes stop_codon:yes gene_type:complete